MTEPKATGDTLLLNIFERMGSLQAKVEQVLANEKHAAESRAGIYEAQETIRGDVREMKSHLSTLSSRVTTMEPDVVKMTSFRAQLAVAVFVVTTVVTGAFNLIYIGLSNMDKIKQAFREFLR